MAEFIKKENAIKLLIKTPDKILNEEYSALNEILLNKH